VERSDAHQLHFIEDGFVGLNPSYELTDGLREGAPGKSHGGRKEGRSEAGSDPEKLSDGQSKEQKTWESLQRS
jgi:hypothetical protein